MNYSYMEGDHVIVVFVVTVFLVLYALVLPIATTIAIFKAYHHNSNNVNNVNQKQNLKELKRNDWINKSIGFLTKGYRRDYMWWEVGPVLIRKMLLMLTSRVVVSSFDQSLVALLIVAIAYNLQITVQPFQATMFANSKSYANDCERLSLGTITVSLFVSLLYTQYKKWSIAFTIGLGILNFIVIVYLCLTIMIEVRYESEIKVNKKELLTYDTDVEFADHVLMCILPSFSCCIDKESSCCQKCFPSLIGLKYVSKKSDDDGGGERNGDVEMTGSSKSVKKRKNTRSSGYSVAFKVDDPNSLEADEVKL